MRNRLRDFGGRRNFASSRLCVNALDNDSFRRDQLAVFTQRREDAKKSPRDFSWLVNIAVIFCRNRFVRELYINEILNDDKRFNAGGDDLDE